MKNINGAKRTAEQTINLSDISKGSFLYCLAEAVITESGYYTCNYQNKKTLILK